MGMALANKKQQADRIRMVWIAVLASCLLQACDFEKQDLSGASASKINAGRQTDSAGSMWVIDPKEPGANLPPVGRSLFDYVVTESVGGTRTYNVPFPLTALVQKIETRLGAKGMVSPLKRVLIPLNRSLQRNAARPEFFKYPRAVMAVDTEPAPHTGSSGMYLKDRLYIGYQEKANTMEVISYNEAAGRFEFQVVKDYRPGGKPQVLYANRALCTVCHQNQGPIFARPLWDETNANPKIASLLHAQRRNFYDFPVDQGVDVPNAIDDATNRANEFAASQLFWQEGCESALSEIDSIHCRAQIFMFMLQYLLSGSRQFDTRSPRYKDQFVPFMIRQWQSKWPSGLALPNPDIPNRNPFIHLAQRYRQISVADTVSEEEKALVREVAEQSDIRSIFDPSVPREPLEIWSVTQQNPEPIGRVVPRLSLFVAEADVHRLDAHLFKKGQETKGHDSRYQSICEYNGRGRATSVERLTFRCHQPDRVTDGADGSFAMDGLIYLAAGQVMRGTIDRIVISEGDELRDLEVVGGSFTQTNDRVMGRLEVVQKYSRLHARRANGNAIRNLTFWWKSSGQASSERAQQPVFSGKAMIVMMDDFSFVQYALDRLDRETVLGKMDVFSAKPFRRARVMKALFEQLDLPPLEWCCVDDRGMPDPVVAPDLGLTDKGGDDKETDPTLKAFRYYCAKCHQGLETFPPNFLYGQAKQVRENLNHCAERIFFRLEMWNLSPHERFETPMPPVNALRRFKLSPEQWSKHSDLAMLKNYASTILKSQTGNVPTWEDFRARGYDNLRECLPGPGSAEGNVFREKPQPRS